MVFYGGKEPFLKKGLSPPKPLSLPKTFPTARHRDGRLDTVHPDVVALSRKVFYRTGVEMLLLCLNLQQNMQISAANGLYLW